MNEFLRRDFLTHAAYHILTCLFFVTLATRLGNVKMLKTLVMFSLLIVSTNFAAAEEGWVSLFNGKSLEGWTQKNGWASYTVEDGTIVGQTALGSPNSFLCSVKKYGDFELEFEVKVHDQLNSGCQIRSMTKDPTEKEREGNWVGRVYGPQVEIEAGVAEAGYVYGEATGRGWLTPEERLKPHDKMKSGEWNTFRIVAQGPRIQTFINGQPIEDLTDAAIYETHPKGFIGLQVHGIGKETGPFDVSWRNIRIKELN